MNVQLIKEDIAALLDVTADDVEILEDPNPEEHGLAVVDNVEYLFDCYRISEKRDGRLREGSLRKF